MTIFSSNRDPQGIASGRRRPTRNAIPGPRTGTPSRLSERNQRRVGFRNEAYLTKIEHAFIDPS